MLWSIVVILTLPDSPASPAPPLTRRLFTPTDRAILVHRMRGNLSGADVKSLKWYQIKEAAMDWKIWLMGAMGAAIYVCNGGVTAFGSLIIKVRSCYRDSSRSGSKSKLPLAYRVLDILLFVRFSCRPQAVLLPVFLSISLHFSPIASAIHVASSLRSPVFLSLLAQSLYGGLHGQMAGAGLSSGTISSLSSEPHMYYSWH